MMAAPTLTVCPLHGSTYNTTGCHVAACPGNRANKPHLRFRPRARMDGRYEVIVSGGSGRELPESEQYPRGVWETPQGAIRAADHLNRESRKGASALRRRYAAARGVTA